MKIIIVLTSQKFLGTIDAQTFSRVEEFAAPFFFFLAAEAIINIAFPEVLLQIKKQKLI